MSACSDRPGGTVITTSDQDALNPILGGPDMTELMARDREAWEIAGALIVRAFAAGKGTAAQQRTPCAEDA